MIKEHYYLYLNLFRANEKIQAYFQITTFLFIIAIQKNSLNIVQEIRIRWEKYFHAKFSVGEENLKIATLENVKTNALNRFNATIEKAFADFETARLKENLYRKQIEITKAAINILESNYSAKGDKFDERLELELELINYDLKILRSIVLSHQAKAAIEKFIVIEK